MDRALTILREKRDVLERSARKLLEKETLDEKDLAALIGPPPASPPLRVAADRINPPIPTKRDDRASARPGAITLRFPPERLVAWPTNNRLDVFRLGSPAHIVILDRRPPARGLDATKNQTRKSFQAAAFMMRAS